MEVRRLLGLLLNIVCLRLSLLYDIRLPFYYDDI